MRYMKTEIESVGGINVSISIKFTDNVVSFPAQIGNQNYDLFLAQANLTDKEVKALKANLWFETV